MSIHELYDLCKKIISSDITLFNGQEMIEQHTSTYDVLSAVFGDTLNRNIIARKLREIIPHDDMFFSVDLLEDTESDKPPVTSKAKLKAIKDQGAIILDTSTTLKGVPASAWDYKLGNRSALEWVLDRYKEHNPATPSFETNSTPTALPITKSRSLNYYNGCAPSALNQ